MWATCHFKKTNAAVTALNKIKDHVSIEVHNGKNSSKYVTWR